MVCRRVAGMPLPENEEVKIRRKIKYKLPTFANEEDLPKYTAAHFYAALYVQVIIIIINARNSRCR
jgi:hypothetical protein